MINSINRFIVGAIELINNTATLVLKLAAIGLMFIIEQWAEKHY